MSIIFDLLAIAIIIFSAIICYNRGILKSIYKSIGFIAALIVALIISGAVSILIRNAFMDKAVYNVIEKTICGKDNQLGYEDLVQKIEQNESDFMSVLERFDVSKEDITNFITETGEKSEEKIDNLIQGISIKVSEIFSNILAFAICFLLSYILIKIVFSLINLIAEHSPLKTPNRILGFLYGLVLGVIRVSIFALVAGLLFPALYKLTGGINFEEILDNTVVLKWFTENNLIYAIINLFV